MPMREYLCSYCGHEFESLVYEASPEDYQTTECRCGSRATLLPSVSSHRGSFGTVSRSIGKQTSKRFNGNVDEPISRNKDIKLYDET